MKTIGRRKCSIATVEILNKWKSEETSKFLINNKSKEDYFQNQPVLLKVIKSPFITQAHQEKYHVNIKVQGGGLVSQAYAIRLGIARVLSDGNFFYELYKKHKKEFEEKYDYRRKLFPSREKIVKVMFLFVNLAHLSQFFEKLKLKKKNKSQPEHLQNWDLPELKRLTEKGRADLEKKVYYLFTNVKARAKILEYIAEKKADFKVHSYLTRDPRVKERRKYGRKKARKSSQFSKR